MKTLKLFSILLLAGTVSVFAQKTDIKLDKSTVKWTGTKIAGSHNGEIGIKSGYLVLKDGNITGGKVVMDMTSITDLDLEDKEYNQQLVGHLKSDDFFGVEKFPTSSFIVAKATEFKNGTATVTGTLHIKGKSDTITFKVTKNGNTYSAQVKVDRSKYDVRYGSNSFFDNLGDKAIDDIFILDVTLVL